MARLLATLAVVLAAALLAGCGSDGGDEQAGPPSATCEPRSILPVLKASIDDESINLRISTVEVLRCRNGYAEVMAVPDNADCQPGVGFCYDSARVFLGRDDDEWSILDVGTGIGCEDADLTEDLIAACEALAGTG